MSTRSRAPLASPAVSAAVDVPQPTPNVPARAPERGGVLGWFQRAGDWAAEKYHATTDAIGEALYTTGRVASDAWDVVKTTDVSWSNGTLGVDTDLKEVLDLLPPGARDRLRLDERASNRVSVAVDMARRELSLRSDALDLEGLDLGAVRSGPASLRGVTVRVRNPGDALSLLSGPLADLTRDGEGVSVEIGVESADARRVTLAGPDGPVDVQQLAVRGLRGSASDGAGLPFGPDALGTRASVSIADASLAGVRHAAGTLDAVGVSGLSGGLDARAETGFLELARATASGARAADGTAVDGASLTDARLDLRNPGGGLPGLDGRPDAISARVEAREARADALRVAGGGVGHAEAQGVSAGWTAGDSTLALAARQLGARDAGFAGWHLDEGAADGLHGTIGGGSVAGGAAALSLEGLSGSGVEAGGVTARGVRGARGADGAWHAAADLAGVEEAGAAGWWLGSGEVEQATARGRGGAVSGGAARLALGDLASDGGTRIGDATATDVTAASGGGEVRVGADTLALAHAASGEVSTDAADARAPSARIAGGRTAITVPSATVRGFDAHRFHAALAELGGAEVAIDREGLAGSVESAAVHDAEVAGGLRVALASVSDASGSVVGDRRRTEIGTADVAGLSLPGIGAAGHLGLADLAIDSRGDAVDARLAALRATDLAAGGATARAATAEAVRMGHQPGRTSWAAGAVGLTDAAVGGTARADRLDATGLGGVVDDRGVSARADRVDAAGISLSVAPGSGGGAGGLDGGALASSLARRVDRADAILDVPVAAGAYRAGVDVAVPRDTTLSAGLKVRDGRLDDLHARFADPVDGPLWTELRGLYTDRGALKADVGGWFDQDVGGAVNGALGLGGDRLHPVPAYVDAARTLPAAPAAPGTPGLGDALDWSRLAGSAAVHLSPGRVDAGTAAVTLTGADAATNRLEGHTLRGGGLAVDAPQLRAGDARATVGGLPVTTGAVAIDGARAALDLAGPGAGAITGGADAATVRDLRLGR